MMDNEEIEGEEPIDPGATLPGAPEPVPADDTPIEAVNLVAKYRNWPKDPDWLIEAGRKLVKQVREDDASREDWLKNREQEIKLYAGPNEWNAALGGNAPRDPVSTRTLLQLWSRGWDQICPAKGTLVQVHPNGPSDQDAASQREKHMNWQLRHKVSNWVMGHAQSYLRFIQSGSEFREASYNPETRCSEFTPCGADDVIVSYSRPDVDPLMVRVPRVTRRLRLFRWEVDEKVDGGMFDADQIRAVYDKDAPTVAGEEEPSVVTEAGIKIDGVEPPSTTLSRDDDKDLRPREFFRAQTWLKLPDGDRLRPVMFTVDRKTGIPVSLTIREDIDPFDQLRYENEMKKWELEAQNATAQYQMALQQWQALRLKGVPAAQPAQPKLGPQPRPPRTRVIHNFIHYRLFHNPAGFYGIGVGYLLKNANLLINKLEAEYLQAARLANTKGGLLPVGALPNNQGGSIEWEPGRFKQTGLEPEQMAGIREFSFSAPSDGLWKFIMKLRDDCSTLVADVDTMSGEAGPTNETKAAAEQRMFNATALISIIVRLYLEPLKEEVKILAHHNRLFMDETEMFLVTEQTADGAQGAGFEQINRNAYKDEFDFTFTADQRLQTQPERIQTIANLITQLLQVPFAAQDPQRAPALFYVALVKLFRALDMPEFEKALGPAPPPPQPPQPPAPMSQVDENALFFQEQDHPVLPDDRHAEHLQDIAILRASSYFGGMSATGKQLLDRHERAHLAAMYQAEAQMGGPFVGAQGMEPGPGMGGGRGNGAPAPGAGGPPGGEAQRPPGEVQDGGFA